MCFRDLLIMENWVAYRERFIEEMKKYLVLASVAPPGTAGGPCTVTLPVIDISQIKTKLNSFKV